MNTVPAQAAGLYALLQQYEAQNEQERSDRALMLRYLQKGHTALTREDTAAHFTASAWVVNPARTHVLMAYHNIYKSWAWLGGHADGDDNLFAVAAREAEEETGVRPLRPLSTQPVSMEVLNVNAHIKRGQYVSNHLHFNVTYLFEADPEGLLAVRPDENSAVGWRQIDWVLRDCNEEQMVPIYQKLLALMQTI